MEKSIIFSATGVSKYFHFVTMEYKLRFELEFVVMKIWLRLFFFVTLKII